MKLFFCFKALPVILFIMLLSGCGSAAGNSGQNYSNQMVEATMLSKAGQSLPQRDENTHAEDNIKPENVLTKPDLFHGNDHSDFARTVAKNVHLGKENIGEMSKTELVAKLGQIAAKTDIAATDAFCDTKTWVIKKEKAGVKLDLDKIVKAALSADAGKEIKYAYMTVKPEVTAAQLKGEVKLIAKFSTPLLDRSKSRVKNIRLAVKKIDRKIILPDEEFSFNHATGSRTKKLGYEDATIIVKTPKGPIHEKAPGGGVCQVSTTIYNAVLACGLKVTEQHEHSDDVHYVPAGKDATVTYNGADFKFINNRKNPIMLRVYVGKRTVRVMILENSGLNAQKG